MRIIQLLFVFLLLFSNQLKATSNLFVHLNEVTFKSNNLFLTISVFLALIINSYLQSKNSDIQIVSKWHECKPNNCEYKLEIENTSNLRKSVFVRINAFYRKVHPEGGDTFHVVNSERIEINMMQSSKQKVSGNIKVPLKAHFLKFTVGTI